MTSLICLTISRGVCGGASRPNQPTNRNRSRVRQAAAPADRLSRLSRRRQRAAGVGADGRRGAGLPIHRYLTMRCRTASSRRSGRRSAERMTLLLTGVAGFIGAALASRLLRDGESVFGITICALLRREGRKRRGLALLQRQPGFRFATIDIADPAAMASLFDRERFDRICIWPRRSGCATRSNSR